MPHSQRHTKAHIKHRIINIHVDIFISLLFDRCFMPPEHISIIHVQRMVDYQAAIHNHLELTESTSYKQLELRPVRADHEFIVIT